jgi:hypothetical protein
VVWRLDDGTVSLDALRPDQHVGDALASSDSAARQARLRDALSGP